MYRFAIGRRRKLGSKAETAILKRVRNHKVVTSEKM